MYLYHFTSRYANKSTKCLSADDTALNFHCIFENKLILNTQNNISTNNSAIRESQDMKNKISLQSYKNHTLENNRLSNPIKLTNLKFNNLAIFLYDM